MRISSDFLLLRTTACDAKRVFAKAGASFRLSDTLLYCVKTTQCRIMKYTLCDSLKSLVSYEVILVPLGEEIPHERGHQIGLRPLRNRYFTNIGSSSVKTVADRHRLAAYHNKHCPRALQWY